MAVPVQVLDPTWINAPGGLGPTYDSEELRRNQGFMLAGGATPGTSRTGVLNPRDLAVTLAGSNVMVGPGGAVIGSTKGAYLSGVTASTNIGAFTPADGTNPRRDRIVLEILDPDNGGGAGRKAQLRIVDGVPNALAATGGGVAAEPTLAITLGFLDVPKGGGGAPVITARPPITTAAGAPVPVYDAAGMNALPLWAGVLAQRLDDSGLVWSRETGVWERVTSRGRYATLYITQSTATTSDGGIGSPALLGQSLVAAESKNPGFISFPGVNQIRATEDCVISIQWAAKFFGTNGTTPVAATGVLTISGPNGDVEAPASFAAVGDTGVSLSNMFLGAGKTLTLTMNTSTQVTCKHRLRIACIA